MLESCVIYLMYISALIACGPLRRKWENYLGENHKFGFFSLIYSRQTLIINVINDTNPNILSRGTFYFCLYSIFFIYKIHIFYFFLTDKRMCKSPALVTTMSSLCTKDSAQLLSSLGLSTPDYRVCLCRRPECAIKDLADQGTGWVVIRKDKLSSSVNLLLGIKLIVTM